MPLRKKKAMDAFFAKEEGCYFSFLSPVGKRLWMSLQKKKAMDAFFFLFSCRPKKRWMVFSFPSFALQFPNEWTS